MKSSLPALIGEFIHLALRVASMASNASEQIIGRSSEYLRMAVTSAGCDDETKAGCLDADTGSRQQRIKDEVNRGRAFLFMSCGAEVRDGRSQTPGTTDRVRWGGMLSGNRGSETIQ
jgi:hypothetical protein